MNRLTIAFCCFVLFYSCKKDKPDTRYATPAEYRNHPAVSFDTNAVWGVMMVERNAPNDEAWAWFYNIPHTIYVKVDSVSLNDFDCDYPFLYLGHDETYPENMHHTKAIPGYNYSAMFPGYTSFKDDSAILWRVFNANTMLLQYDHVGSFPEYSAPLPDTINFETGNTFVFDSSTVKGADSVQILIYKDLNQPWRWTKTFGAHIGSINILDSSLRDFANGYCANCTTSNKMEMIFFTYTFQSFSGKTYAFVKQKKYTKGIKYYPR